WRSGEDGATGSSATTRPGAGRASRRSADMKRDVVVIGAGHNGLVCAALIAEAGHNVTVVEARALPGGACVSEELWPGYQVSTTSYVSTLLLPQVVQRFELGRH